MPQINNRINLNQHDKDWFFAWAGVKEMDIGDQIANLIGFRIRERRDEIWKMIVYNAERRGMNPQNLFDILRVDPKWLKNNPVSDDELPAVEPLQQLSLIEQLKQTARDREMSLVELLEELRVEASQDETQDGQT